MSINQKISKDVSNKLGKIFFKCRKLLSFFSLKLFLKNPDVYFSNRIERILSYAYQNLINRVGFLCSIIK